MNLEIVYATFGAESTGVTPTGETDTLVLTAREVAAARDLATATISARGLYLVSLNVVPGPRLRALVSRKAPPAPSTPGWTFRGGAPKAAH